MEALRCPSCGSPNLTKVDDTDYKCLNCETRSKLTEDRTFLILQQGWLCPKCSFNNESQSKYCGKCGNKLVQYCSNCRNEVQLGIKFCPRCGKEYFSANFPPYRVLLVDIGKRHFKVIEALSMINPERSQEDRWSILTKHDSVILETIREEDARNTKALLESLGATVEIS